MWWRDIQALGQRLATEAVETLQHKADDAIIDEGVHLDDSQGPILIGNGVRICSGAIIRGPVVIGAGSMVGNYAIVRGPTVIGERVTIGSATEIKQAVIGDRVSIGPQCYVADSRVDDDAYLGAMVRTSNQRLDRQPIRVHHDNAIVETGCKKLGCWIGTGASLGIQVIILPGRVIASETVLEPRVTVTRNLPSGRYRVAQTLQAV
jgi:NDP-sugar pyrophosphorylase family protein